MGIFDFFRRTKKRDEEIIIEVPEHLKAKKEEIPASKRYWKGTQIVGIEKLEENSVDEFGNTSTADNENIWGSNDNSDYNVEINKPSKEEKKRWKEEAREEGNSNGLFNMFE